MQRIPGMPSQNVCCGPQIVVTRGTRKSSGRENAWEFLKTIKTAGSDEDGYSVRTVD